MDTANLVKMANRIGDFFAAMPDQEAAAAEVAQHLRKFWEPRMRSALLGHLDQHAGEGLSPLLLRAVQDHRSSLAVPAGPRPAAGAQ